MEKYDVEVSEAGDVRYYKKGTLQLHRLDGPAIEYADGTKFWFQDDRLHRLDGPAIECGDGTKFWCQNDNLHRLDGPAVIFANGTKSWYIEGVNYIENEFKKKINRLNTEEMTIAEIEAKLGHGVKVIK